MPTYTFRCPVCSREIEPVMSISQYVNNPPFIVCCGEPSQRRITVMNGFSGQDNALAGDRHYDGMRAPDGTDISTRSKHREYMKKNNLTTVDDFAGTWKRAANEQKARMAGEDPSRKADIARAIEKLGG